nr:MAG TPA: hypothetical protein [Caudoviricetes sp.]
MIATILFLFSSFPHASGVPVQAGEWGWIQNKKRLPHRMGKRLMDP